MSDNLELLFKFSEDQLYEQLGRQSGRGFGPTNLIRAGQEIFENSWAVVSNIVCSSERVMELYRFADGSGAEVAAAIADCIVGCLQGIPAATVAVLIVKRGLPKLCPAPWPAPLS